MKNIDEAWRIQMKNNKYTYEMKIVDEYKWRMKKTDEEYRWRMKNMDEE